MVKTFNLHNTRVTMVLQWFVHVLSLPYVGSLQLKHQPFNFKHNTHEPPINFKLMTFTNIS